MNVGRICSKPAVTAGPADTLASVARLMRERHVGYVIIVDDDASTADQRPLGVLTDRDLVVSVLAEGVSPIAVTVGDVMNTQPVTVDETDSVKSALQTMRRIGVRRLPVVGRNGALVGVLSLDDVLDRLADDVQELAGVIRNEQRIESIVRT